MTPSRPSPLALIAFALLAYLAPARAQAADEPELAPGPPLGFLPTSTSAQPDGGGGGSPIVLERREPPPTWWPTPEISADVGLASATFGSAVPRERDAVFRVAGALVFGRGRFELAPELSLDIVSMPYQTERGRGRATLSSLYAGAALGVWPLEQLRLAVELGAGARVLTGLGEGNPFTVGQARSGDVPFLAARAGISLAWRMVEGLALTVSPFSLSVSPARADLLPLLERIVRVDLLLGLAYRL